MRYRSFIVEIGAPEDTTRKQILEEAGKILSARNMSLGWDEEEEQEPGEQDGTIAPAGDNVLDDACSECGQFECSCPDE